MKTRRIKVGSNRGKARIWLQGNSLRDAGFVRGARYSYEFPEPGKLVIKLADDAPFMVAGREDMPIIDINTDKLLAVGAVGTYTSATFRKGRVTLVSEVL